MRLAVVSRSTAEQRRTSRQPTACGLSCLQDTLNKLQGDVQRHEHLVSALATRMAVRQGLAKRTAGEHKAMTFHKSGYVFMKTLGMGRHGMIKVAKRKTTEHVKRTQAVAATECTKELVSQFVAVRIIRRGGGSSLGGVGKGELLSTKESHATLMRHITALRELDHPNIQREIETFEDGQNIYVVMELYTGSDLLARESSPLPEARAAWCINQICSAAAHAHENGIVHQDLRPDNVHYATTSPDARLVVTDWACVEYIDTPPQDSRQHLIISEYSAPELNPKRRTDRSDAWSIGVMAHALLTLALPFGDHGPRADPTDFQWHESDQPVSDACRDFIQSLLRIDPAVRMSARTALQHPWLQQVREAGCNGRRMSMSSSVVSSLLRYKDSTVLQRTAAALAADHLSGEKLCELTEQFNLLDKDGDGKIEKADMIEALRNTLDAEKPKVLDDPDLEDLTDDIEELLNDKAKVTALLNLMDTDGDGKISYSDFLAAAGEALMVDCAALCWEAFRAFDRDGNGTISKGELEVLLSGPLLDEVMEKTRSAALRKTKTKQDFEEAFKELGGAMGTVDEMLRKADANHDQRISFEEFMTMIVQ